MTSQDKQLEALLVREEKEEGRSVQHALKDLKSTNSADVKAHKMVDKAVHSLEKAQTKEHKMAKAVSKAAHNHDDAAAGVVNAERNIGIKQRHMTQLDADLEQKKQDLEEAQRQKEQHDSMRNAKRAEMLGFGGPNVNAADSTK
ncbi:hypothetical protein EXIGLDRAFT_670383 [Exidia glandulosa HHB12029]|uniref:Uncharacterized protein n=1 Tax=Exidia glandulosa HHB12029 TaxID=1314781 RepID=A0A165L119_EXIGL|nr:hypothetical protein EXIGLDRAFT_670383 [Exidia glandulosa HHB12029]